MFTSLAQCAKVPLLFLEESGNADWAVGNVCCLVFVHVQQQMQHLACKRWGDVRLSFFLNMNQNLAWIIEC